MSSPIHGLRMRWTTSSAWYLPPPPPAAPPPRPTPAADERPTRDAARDTATPDPATGRRDDHLQRDRGSRRVGGGHARLVVGVDRLRARLGGRDLVGGSDRVAVLRQGPRDAREARA